MIKDSIQLSPEFRKQTTRAIMAIVLFAAVYLALVAITVGMTVLCIYGGLLLIISAPHGITIVLGAGISSIGILVLFFLIKFIFRSNKVDGSHLIEVKKEQEPELFGLISDIVTQVGTHFPKKVYFSADVNAAVFYDSSFWSMFFPVRKNLQIGLGLINSVSDEELKAILAHEFGHFSQRTMKVGSYVYNVNQVIFNMLFDNQSFDKLAQGWASVSGYIALFVVVAVKIVEGIQWVLKKMYGVVNISYMGLSREMEFHADEIAGHVTGYQPLRESLLRMQLADYSLQAVINFYNGKIKDNLKSENIYPEHQYVLNYYAKESDLPFQSGLPQVSIDELNKYNKSKLVIKDQWASHPSTEERIGRLEKLNVPATHKAAEPANRILKNLVKVQKQLTAHLFLGVTYKGAVQNNTLEAFINAFETERRHNTFHKAYNGYYDNKYPIPFETAAAAAVPGLCFEDLYSPDKLELVYQSIALHNDKAVLTQVSSRELKIKTFDYDGQKYRQQDSPSLVIRLGKELDHTNALIKENDMNIFTYFSQLEKEKGVPMKLETLYKDFFAFDKAFDKKHEVCTQLMEGLQFVSQTTPYEQIKTNFKRLLPLEAQLKGFICEMMADRGYGPEITDEMKLNFERYTKHDLVYFASESYFEDNLTVVFTALNHFQFLLSRGYFLFKKKLLDYQIELLNKAPA